MPSAMVSWIQDAGGFCLLILLCVMGWWRILGMLDVLTGRDLGGAKLMRWAQFRFAGGPSAWLWASVTSPMRMGVT